MYKGIYIAASGAVLMQKQMDVITQNIANANTTGYKKDSIAFREYLLPRTGQKPDNRVMSTFASQSTDFSNGGLIQTGNPLDVAIEGDGFIALEGGRFTRRGDLRRDKDGYLVTGNGLKVMGSAGPIQLPDGDISIKNDGAVEVNNTTVDTISLRSFPDQGLLTKAGAGVFTSTESGRPSNARLRQGVLEASNVEVVSEMVCMISAVREFESFQKAIHIFDEATSKVNNEMARV